ncbi:MAG: imidazoleglycerol-phosphate dehydratase HisB [Ignavibacteriales bacterium]|nr:imidazoleglycerol-phosphate dehydratase HisB [Ignavibacteriales bacterium]
MTRLVVSPDFFSYRDDRSRGLLAGLWKLYDLGVEIAAPKWRTVASPETARVVEREAPPLENADEAPLAHSFLLRKPDEEPNAIALEDGETAGEALERCVRLIRRAKVSRTTKETDVLIEVALDGAGAAAVGTGVGFFDHMLEQIARHANIDLTARVKGDLHVDEHHTVEDTGIALGEAILKALGEKRGLQRYGFHVPMDEANARCAIDLSGRPYLNYKCKFSREKVGDFPTELTEEFFRGLAVGLKATVYLRAKGENDHHKIEASFKAFAKALNQACRLDARARGALPSTKGLL